MYHLVQFEVKKRIRRGVARGEAEELHAAGLAEGGMRGAGLEARPAGMGSAGWEAGDTAGLETCATTVGKADGRGKALGPGSMRLVKMD
jgi:hypothetical protein